MYFRFRVRHFEIQWSVYIANFSAMSVLSPVLRTWSKIFGILKEFCLMTLVFDIVNNFMTFRPFWRPSCILEVSRDQGKTVVLWTNPCRTKRFLPRIDISHRSRVTSRWMLWGVILPPPPLPVYVAKKPLPVWGLNVSTVRWTIANDHPSVRWSWRVNEREIGYLYSRNNRAGNPQQVNWQYIQIQWLPKPLDIIFWCQTMLSSGQRGYEWR